MKKINWLLFLPILISVAILLPASLTPNLFVFESFGWNEVGQLLTFLILISLFLERALEVFITTWRSPRIEELDNNVQACERRISELKALLELHQPKNGEDEKKQGSKNSTDKAADQDSENVSDLKDRLANRLGELEGINLKRAEYRAQTRKIALWTALFIGLLISGVGIRSLETLIRLKEFPPDQQPIFYMGQVCIFRILDTVLTGGLIAGGSDGIHKLTQVFTAFLEVTRNKIKDSPN